MPLDPIKIPWIPGAFGGWDRYDPPAPAWMEKLLHRSNFSFVWHYFSHEPRPDFQKFKETWKKIYYDVNQQGWGIVFTYVPLSQERPPSWKHYHGPHKVDAAKKLGREHAQYLKSQFVTALESSNPDAAQDAGLDTLQGAVVMIDNEDQNGTHMRDEVLAYYTEMFREMRRLGNEGIALRPGLYSRLQPLSQFLAHDADNEDLFLWAVDEEFDNERVRSGPQLLNNPWYLEQPGPSPKWPRIYTPIERHVMKSPTYETKQKAKRTALLMGRQWGFYHCLFPRAKSTFSKYLAPPAKDIDFNVSLVRDPRYPIAVPRIAVSEDLQIRSVFSADKDVGAASNVVATTLEQVFSVDPSPLPCASQDDLIEHEAPLILLQAASDRNLSEASKIIALHPKPPGLDPELFTLNTQGQLVTFRASSGGNPAGSWTWTGPTKLQPLSLRRNRAIVAVKMLGKKSLDTQIFFVDSKHVLHGIRRLNNIPWSAPADLADGKPIHPFSNIAVAARDRETVHVFFLDSLGRLSTVLCTSARHDWPNTNNYSPLQDEPTLLLGTHLAAVSPSPSTVIAFAVGRDCNLHMVTFTDSTWSKVAVVAGVPEEDYRLFPHAQIAAYATSATSICVATLIEVNVPCVYNMRLEGSEWVLKGRYFLRNKPDTKGSISSTSRIDAAPGCDFNPEVDVLPKQFAFNPFGDIKLSMVESDLVIWIPGVITTATGGLAGDRSAMLFLKGIKFEDETDLVWMYVK